MPNSQRIISTLVHAEQQIENQFQQPSTSTGEFYTQQAHYIAQVAPQQQFYKPTGQSGYKSATPQPQYQAHYQQPAQQNFYLSTPTAAASSTASIIHSAYNKQRFVPVVPHTPNKELADDCPYYREEEEEEEEVYFSRQAAPPQFQVQAAPASAPPVPNYSKPRTVAGARFYKSETVVTQRYRASVPFSQTATANMQAVPQQNRFYSVEAKYESRLLVEYNEEGSRKLGFIVGQGNSSSNSSSSNSGVGELHLEDLDGQSKIVDPKELTYQFPPQLVLMNEQDVHDMQHEIACLVDKAQTRVEEIWRSFLQSKKSFAVTGQDVASMVFESQTPIAIYAAHTIMAMNPVHFKQVSPALFECRSVREVEEKKHMPQDQRQEIFSDKLFLIKLLNALLSHPSTNDAIKDQYTLTKAKTLREIRFLQADKSVGYDDARLDMDNDSLRIDLLKTFALGKCVGVEQTVYEKFLRPLGLDNNTATAFSLCRKLNLFEMDNIHLLRANIANVFPKEIEEIAKGIRDNHQSLPDPDSKIRRDLSHLDAFAIDSIPDTEEIDDAVSVEVREDGSEYIYVHIADPTRYIPYGSKMEQEAFTRVTSIYLPEMKVPMLPRALSVDLLSLSEKKKQNYTLTFSARILPTGELTEYEIFPAIVSNVQRLDYDETDQVFEQVATVEEKTYEVLQRMLRIANTRLEYRIKRGASPFNLPRSDISIDSRGKVNVEASKELTSHSRRLVQEFMIIANEISAKYAHANNITIPYRATFGGIYEEKPNASALSVNISMSEAELASIVVEHHLNSQNNSGSACFSQLPSFHFGLGVDAYAQVTSPIRRYCDLLIHYQLKAKMRGETEPMEWDTIQKMLVAIEQKTRSISQLQRNSERFWLYKYFEQNLNKLFKAIVLESANENFNLVKEFQTLVYLIDLGLKTKVKLNRELALGDTVMLTVTQVIPHTDVLRLDEVEPAQLAQQAKV